MTSFVYRIHFTNGLGEMLMSARRAIGTVQKQISEIELDAIREATNKAWALGNDRYKEKMRL